MASKQKGAFCTVCSTRLVKGICASCVSRQSAPTVVYVPLPPPPQQGSPCARLQQIETQAAARRQQIEAEHALWREQLDATSRQQQTDRAAERAAIQQADARADAECALRNYVTRLLEAESHLRQCQRRGLSALQTVEAEAERRLAETLSTCPASASYKDIEVERARQMYDMVRDYVTILLDAEEEQTRSADKEQARRLLAEARATRPPLASDADVALERTHQLRQRRQLELEKLPARVIAVLDAQDELHRKTHLALRDTSTKNWDARSTAFKLFLAKTAEAAPRQLSQQEYDAEYSRQQTIRERNPAQPLPMPGACPLQTEPVMEFRNAAGGRMACIVALDCSGSMTGQGAQHAQRVLFAIHDITRRLGIPSEDVLCVPFGWASGQHKRFCSSCSRNRSQSF